MTFTKNGLATDLLWADPDYGLVGWAQSVRGISHNFGADVVKDICKTLNIDLIARAHQVVDDGFQFFRYKSMDTLELLLQV